MRGFLRTTALALLVATALTCPTAHAEQAALAQPAAGAARFVLLIGDKLKIAFYETIDVAAKANGRDTAESQAALRTFYQRMDVSGDYAIEQDGAISIPLLGRFQIEGRSLDDVRAELARAFSSTTGRAANIDVKIIDRSPVYVVGPVKNPGAYKYVPGMIVLHAVALAGGIDRGEQGLSRMIEGARQMERLQSTMMEMQQLLARRARLLAERDGRTELTMPVQLSALAGNAARDFLATESTVLLAEEFKRQQERREIGVKIAAARSEVDALRRKLEQAEVQKDLRTERLDDVQKLKDKGLVTNANVLVLRSELSDIEARRQDVRVELLQAQARLAEVEGSPARHASDRAVSLATAIASVDKELAVAQQAVASARLLSSVLYRPDNRAQGGDSYEIVRQSRDGATMLPATETSSLLPGDVLKINQGSAANEPTSSITVAPVEPVLPPIQPTNGSLTSPISWRVGVGVVARAVATTPSVDASDTDRPHARAIHHRHRRHVHISHRADPKLLRCSIAATD